MPAEPRVTEAAPAPPGPASVSPADTIREKAQRIIDNPQSPYGGSESGDEAWYWTNEWLADFARDVLALLAVGERDRQQIARLTEALERIANEPPNQGLTPNFREFARAVLADEEDAE